MPLTRYEIRNEYSLADPELYKAADKDDPEALLEGVAMAGLVGLLRQLGDLAEFAAEVFHDLHEEVMATAARGHGLMVRVQQLEAEVPSIERTFLSQINHKSFFSNAGADWHPNLNTNQNLLTRGDLPRCVMDSYEECRGPPRLFLLDKFDVAGAGACLKRYTDPSFFKAETTSTVGVFREKKIRKGKKKGTRWRNGETPDLLPKSHPKLHQLLLEERVENGFSDPARLVKLKRRLLNAPVLDPKSGKSYMEKFLETLSPENKQVCEISVTPPALKLTPESSSESGLEIVEISAMSSPKKSVPKDNSLSSPHEPEIFIKPSMEEFNADIIDRQIVPVSSYGEIDDVPTTHPGMMTEKELLVDGQGNCEGSVNGNHSDDMTSELDNYMDALATMESEVDTDNEYRPNNYLDFSGAKNRGTDSDETEEQFKVRPHFSDSQSFGNSSVSDDGISSFKRGRSSFSCSDTFSNQAENVPAEGDATPIDYPTEAGTMTIVDIPSDQLHAAEEISHSDAGSDADLGEGSCSLGHTGVSPSFQPADPVAKSLVVSQVANKTSEFVKFDNQSSNINGSSADCADNSVVSFALSQRNGNSLSIGSAENHSMDDLSGEDLNVLSNPSKVTKMESRGKSLEESLQTDHSDETSSKNLAETKICSPQSNMSAAEDQLPCSALPVEKLGSNIVLLRDNFDDNKPQDTVPEMVTSHSHTEQLFSDIKDDVSEADLSNEQRLPSSEETVSNDCISTMAKSEDISESNMMLDAVESGSVAVDLSPSHPARGCDNDASTGDVDVGTKSVVAIDASTPIAVDDDKEILHPSEELNYSLSQKPTNLEESLSGSGDIDQEGLQSREGFSTEYPAEPDVERENKSDVAPTDLDLSQSVPNGYANDVKSDHILDSSLAEQPQNSEKVGDFSSVPEASKLESESPHQSHLQENVDDAMALPSCDVTEPAINLQQSLNLQEHQVEVECQQADEASSSSYLWSDHMQTLGQIDQEISFDNSDYLQEYFPHKATSSEFAPQSTNQELDDLNTAMNPFVPVPPTFDQLPQTAETSAGEMPPLPPLPPMQWRLGKFNLPQEMPGEFNKQSQHFLPSLSAFMSHETHTGFPPLDRVASPLKDQVIAKEAEEDEKVQDISEEVTNHLVHPTPLSSHWPALVNNGNNQKNSLDMQSRSPFLLPEIANERPDHELPALAGDVPEYGSKLLSTVSVTEDSSSKQDAITSDQNLVQQSDREFTKTDTEAQTHQLPEDEHVNPPSTAFHSLAEIEEQSQHDLLTSEGKLPWPSNTLALAPTFEVQKQNGNAVPKIPRPRSPLVDALAAHDKSMLRKVTDRPRPDVAPKVEERDSILEQIRTKSFNLKPAIVSRPSIQGPKTNLRVAAILEKANAIRQATAGSDEDDDDSWSE